MKYLKFLRTYVCLLLGFAAFTACTSEADEVLKDGKGYVSLSLSIEDRFQTKAVDENDYQDETKYTVQILDSKGSVVGDYTGATIPSDLIELDNGSYNVKAFYGEDKPASTTSMYVEGIKGFDINSNQVTGVTVECAPVCTRVTLVYEGMEEHFKNWEAVIKTKALGESSFIYEKDNTDPVYLKVEKGEKISVSFHLTNSADKVTTIDKTYEVNPNEALKITIKPAASENGNLGISIEIDGSTQDIPVDIEIPSDWV